MDSAWLRWPSKPVFVGLDELWETHEHVLVEVDDNRALMLWGRVHDGAEYESYVQGCVLTTRDGKVSVGPVVTIWGSPTIDEYLNYPKVFVAPLGNSRFVSLFEVWVNESRTKRRVWSMLKVAGDLITVVSHDIHDSVDPPSGQSGVWRLEAPLLASAGGRKGIYYLGEWIYLPGQTPAHQSRGWIQTVRSDGDSLVFGPATPVAPNGSRSDWANVWSDGSVGTLLYRSAEDAAAQPFDVSGDVITMGPLQSLDGHWMGDGWHTMVSNAPLVSAQEAGEFYATSENSPGYGQLRVAHLSVTATEVTLLSETEQTYQSTPGWDDWGWQPKTMLPDGRLLIIEIGQGAQEINEAPRLHLDVMRGADHPTSEWMSPNSEWGQVFVDEGEWYGEATMTLLATQLGVWVTMAMSTWVGPSEVGARPIGVGFIAIPKSGVLKLKIAEGAGEHTWLVLGSVDEDWI